MTAPLFVTRDPQLRAELLRLAASVGVTPDVRDSGGAALGGWSGAPAVLVGVDVVAEVASVGPPRRDGVHVVGLGRIADMVFRTALDVGAESLAELPTSEPWLLELLSDADEGPGRQAVSVAVLGGSGGAGATVFACALALQAARAGSVCLLDGDPLGPGVDRVLGFDRLAGARWEALLQTSGRLSARTFRDSLPRRHGVGLLTWGARGTATLQAFAAREALTAATRGHDTVLLDLPRQGPAVVDELASRCRHRLVVVRASVPGVASATGVVRRLREAGPVGLVVRGSRLAGDEVSRLVGAPVVCAMPDQRGLDEAVDFGLGPVKSHRTVLARAARQALDALAPSGDLRGRSADVAA